MFNLCEFTLFSENYVPVTFGQKNKVKFKKVAFKQKNNEILCFW